MVIHFQNLQVVQAVGTASAVQVFTLYVYNWDTATKALDVISDNFPKLYKVGVSDTFFDTAGTPAVATVKGIADWYDLQEVYADKKWYEVAGKPGTSAFGSWTSTSSMTKCTLLSMT